MSRTETGRAEVQDIAEVVAIDTEPGVADVRDLLVAGGVALVWCGAPDHWFLDGHVQNDPAADAAARHADAGSDDARLGALSFQMNQLQWYNENTNQLLPAFKAETSAKAARDHATEIGDPLRRVAQPIEAVEPIRRDHGEHTRD
jgi:hypothetical protein